MSDGVQGGYSAKRMLAVIVAALVVLAGVLWAMGVFHGRPSNTREVYTTDTKDLSGGKLIVSDESTPKVPVNLPVTRMTNVPAGQASGASTGAAARPSPSPAPSAAPAK